jgi:hypothetical protein
MSRVRHRALDDVRLRSPNSRDKLTAETRVFPVRSVPQGFALGLRDLITCWVFGRPSIRRNRVARRKQQNAKTQ